MHFSIDIEDYTASDSSDSSPVTPLNSNNIQNRRLYSYTRNQYSPSLSSNSSSLYSTDSSENSSSAFSFMPEARVVYERPSINADHVMPLVNNENIHTLNDIENLQEIESVSSIDSNEDLFYSSKIKFRKMTLLNIFIMIIFYLINSIINNSAENGYDNFFILTFRTLSDYPKCEPIQYQIWRLFTNSWLHVNIGHLMSNIVFIYFTGFFLETIVGHYYLLIYFYIGCFGGSLAVAYLNRFSLSIGASHGAMSLSGALLGTIIFNKDVLNYTFNFLRFISLLPLIIDIFSYNFFYNKNISYIGHWVGYINGFLLSSSLSKLIIPQNWKLVMKTTFLNIFILLNIYLLFDYFHYDYKKTAMNEQFQEIEFNTCCKKYVDLNFQHNFTCVY